MPPTHSRRHKQNTARTGVMADKLDDGAVRHIRAAQVQVSPVNEDLVLENKPILAHNVQVQHLVWAGRGEEGMRRLPKGFPLRLTRWGKQPFEAYLLVRVVFADDKGAGLGASKEAKRVVLGNTPEVPEERGLG